MENPHPSHEKLLQLMNNAFIVVYRKERTSQGEPQELQVKPMPLVQKEDQIHEVPAK